MAWLTHTDDGPDIGESAFTITVNVVVQPLAKTYEITETPELTPLMMPDVEPTVAIDSVVEDHIPPAAALVNVIGWPAQTLVAPLIAASAFTFTVVVVLQPVPIV